MPSSQTVVCNLSVFTPDQRVAQLERGRTVLLAATRRTDLENETLFHYEGSERLFVDIAVWAAEEHRCCAWLDFHLTLGEAIGNGLSRIELRLTGGGVEGQAMVREGVAYFATIRDAETETALLAAHETLTPRDAHEFVARRSVA
jgi:hypothetical protein